MAQNSPQPTSQTVNYPDNPDGLKNLMADIFSAAKSKDTATESRLLDSLFLSADSHWFVDQFGPAYGPRMAERYAASTYGLKDQMSLIIANDIQRHWDDIKEITATQGDPDIAKFYIDTWKQYRFAPTFLDGDAVEVETDLTFTFGGP